MERVDAAEKRVGDALRALRDAWGVRGEPMSSTKQETLAEFNAAALALEDAYNAAAKAPNG